MRRFASLSIVAAHMMTLTRSLVHSPAENAVARSIGRSPVIVPALFRDKLAFVSDIHAADPHHPAFRNPLPRIAPVHGSLLLCGDIGLPTEPRFAAFFRQIAPDFDRIFFVPGNHEYDCSCLFDPTKVARYRPALQEVCAGIPNLVLLDNAAVQVDANTRLLGTTLWSDPDPDLLYRRRVSPANPFHANKKWLHDAMRPTTTSDSASASASSPPSPQSAAQRFIVASHFVPTEALIEPRFRALPSHASRLFWSDLEEEFMGEDTAIDGWICGHTHSIRRETVGKGAVDCRVFARPNVGLKGDVAAD